MIHKQSISSNRMERISTLVRRTIPAGTVAAIVPAVTVPNTGATRVGDLSPYAASDTGYVDNRNDRDVVKALGGLEQPRHSRVGGRVKKFVTGLAATAVLMSCALASTAGTASAASSVTGCFGAGSVSVSGLYTQVEYRSSGRWYPVSRSLSSTGENGCVSYTLGGSLRNANVKIAAAGIVPAWNQMVWGSTPRMATPGYGSAFVGWSALYGVALTQESMTQGWLDQMSSPSGNTPFCSTSPAAQMACYMDQHNMQGDVVVPVPRDSDGDGYPDYEDRYPHDLSAH